MSLDMLRRYLAEFLGTFALIFFGCGTRIMVGDTTNPAGILVVHIAFGFTIGAMIYTLTQVSGAHFNPAITFGFALARRFPWRYVLPYWVAQFVGALLASTIHFILLPQDKAIAAHYGATMPKIGPLPALALEIILTFFLMLVSMAMATDRRVKRENTGLAVGFTILLCGLFANSLTGGSMNPARSLGPAVYAGASALGSIWIYFLGPAIGAAIAAFVYEAIRGSEKYAKNVPEELPTKKSVEQLPLENLMEENAESSHLG